MAEQTYRLQIGWVAANRNFGMNVFHYKFDDAGFSSEWAAALALCNSWIATNMPIFLPMLGIDVFINLCSARRISGGGGISASSAVTAGGTNLATSVTSAVAACLKWITVDPDNRPGRTFVGSIYDGALIGDAFTGGFTTAAAAFITAQLTGLAVGAVVAEFVKWDRKTATPFIVTDGTLNPKPSGFNKRTLPVT